ncbi:MAG TPA: hypothetical protein VGJ28_19475 [Micromonosporaceae bacterium]
MTIDIAAARTFVATHARILDRHRLNLLLDHADPGRITTALEAYANPDGGYGWALEPDLRSATSQPAAALHAFEAWGDLDADIGERASRLCDWLAMVSRPDGGLPFGLPMPDPAGSAPWWAGADTTESSLQITAAVVAAAHRVARHTPAVAQHPWLAAADAYCLATIRALDGVPPAFIVSFGLQVLDAVADTVPGAADQIERLVAAVPDDGVLPVEGGADGEALHPLDLAPWPETAVRHRLPAGLIERDLSRLVSLQKEDGGWPIDWNTSSPAAALEWRGYVTVRAIALLRANGVS